MSDIKIKKSKQGSLHTHLGVPQGKKIPASKLKIKSTDSPAIRKKKQFAINARKWKHEDGGLIPEYSWGGVLADTAAGAGMGAMTGAVAGGIGALPGAIIGGAGAFLKGAVGEITGNKQEKLDLAKKRIDEANASFNSIMGGDIQNPFKSTFAFGGIAGGINAEIEKGETALSPDGTMHTFQLPSHANVVGDNFKSFDPGTMIFSDKLKFDKNKTFAQQQNKYKKISDKADKVLSNTGSTFLNKKTAKLNKANSLKLSVDLFGKQEAMKMSTGKTTKFQDGGQTPWWQQGPFYPGSGYTANGVKYPSPDNTFNAMTYGVRPGTYNNPLQLNQVNVEANATQPQSDWRFYNAGSKPRNFVRSSFDPLNPMNMMDIPAAQPIRKSAGATPPITPPTNTGGTASRSTATGLPSFDQTIQQRALDNIVFADSFAPVTPNVATSNVASPLNTPTKLAQMPSYNPNGVQGGGAGMNWGNVGMQALALAPDIYNLGQALFSKPEKIERNRYFNPYTNQIRSRMNDRRFNIDPILAANRNANAVYNRNVSNAAGGDRSRLLSNLLAGMNARQMADASAYSQKINMDNQYAAEQAQMDYNLGAMNAQALAMRDDINARNLAAKRNFGASVTSGLQQYALNQMQMNNQLASQRAYLDVLQRANPFFNQWLGLDDLRSYGKNNR